MRSTVRKMNFVAKPSKFGNSKMKKVKKIFRKLDYWYFWNIRKPLARRIPYGSSCGFRFGSMDSGEIELILNVEGREGSVYLSEEMWQAIGEKAGFTQSDSSK